MRVLWKKSPDAPPPATGFALASPVALLIVSAWGILACWPTQFLGVRLSAPVDAILLHFFGEDGLRPGRTLLQPIFLALAAAGIAWLLALRRTFWQPPDAHRAEMVSDLKVGNGLTVLFLAGVGSCVLFSIRLALGGPGSWLEENLGPSPISLLGLSALFAATIAAGWLLRRVHRKLNAGAALRHNRVPRSISRAIEK